MGLTAEVKSKKQDSQGLPALDGTAGFTKDGGGASGNGGARDQSPAVGFQREARALLLGTQGQAGEGTGAGQAHLSSQTMASSPVVLGPEWGHHCPAGMWALQAGSYWTQAHEGLSWGSGDQLRGGGAATSGQPHCKITIQVMVCGGWTLPVGLVLRPCPPARYPLGLPPGLPGAD